MKSLIAKALLNLVLVDITMRREGIAAIQRLLKRARSNSRTTLPYSAEQICHAVDIASVFYIKRVLCLQRSTATTVLLRRYGFPAELVVGSRIVPFKSHAWVELSGKVINDKPYVADIYTELDRY